MPDPVRHACIACIDDNLHDCSGFVQAVGRQLDITIVGLANDIVDTLRAGAPWTVLAGGPDAEAAAASGKLVIAGLRGDAQAHPDPHGHVVVIVSGTPLNRDLYPYAYWGSLGGTPGKNQTINWAWTEADRDNVTYAAHDLP